MDLTEANVKRARNMVWTAAGDHDIEPRYIYYNRDGEPDLYCNTMVGLGYIVFDEEIMLPFIRAVEAGHDAENYLPMLLSVLAQAIYLRLLEDRPALEDLRLEYAELHLNELRPPQRYEKMGCVRQEQIRCMRILGRELPTEFSKREIELSDELFETAKLSDKEIVSRMKEIYWKYFMYKVLPARREEDAAFLGAGFLVMLGGSKFAEGLWHKRDGQREVEEGSFSYTVKKAWTHLKGESTPEEDEAYILKTFGQCVLPPGALYRIMQETCRGLHKGCRLWYTDSVRSIGEEQKEMLLQRQRNRKYYLDNAVIYEKNIRFIAERLRSSLEEQLEPDTVNTQSGLLTPRRVYRLKTMHDLAVFHKEIINRTPDFTVDLLLDASSSGLKEQESIATQAYIVTSALQRLEIPVQVSCFRSMRGHTVMHRLKGYDEEPEGLFSFYAAGSNRDGLALRTLSPFMEQGNNDPQTKRILLILTDAIPADTKKAYVENSIRREQDYEEALAVNDTREAVLELRRKGMQVAAIFWGLTRNVPDLQKIYGDDYIRIKEISQLPDKVIMLLLRIIQTMRDRM